MTSFGSDTSWFNTEIPAGSEAAAPVNGQVLATNSLAVKEELGDLNIIAGDLGLQRMLS